MHPNLPHHKQVMSDAGNFLDAEVFADWAVIEHGPAGGGRRVHALEARPTEAPQEPPSWWPC